MSFLAELHLEQCVILLGHHIQLMITACSSIIEDGNYDSSLEKSKLVCDIASDVKTLCLSQCEPVNSFCSWLYSELHRIVDGAGKLKKVYKFKERVWSKYHELRTSDAFQSRWIQFLRASSLCAEPLFYQQVSVHIFSELVKEAKKLAAAPLPEEVPAMTYEQENALRYTGGYIVRALRKKNKKDESVLQDLKELCNEDDDMEPAESEEWLCSIDRGGLIRVTEDMYQALLAIECITKTFYQKSLAHKMDDSYKEKVIDGVIDASEVQLKWTLASSSMQEENRELILEQIVTQWVTIRGFSFTKSILEKYKKETKKGTQKAKPLRATLCSTESTSTAAESKDDD